MFREVAAMKRSYVLLISLLLLSSLMLAQATGPFLQNVVATIDSTGFPSHTSMKLSGAGAPVISYINGVDLKIAHCGNVTCISGNVITTADRQRVEAQTSLALNASGNPVVAYYFGDAGVGKSKLKMLFCQDANCQGNTTIMTGAKGESGISPSLALDAAGNPVIVGEFNLQLAVEHCGDPNCASGNSLVTNIASLGGLGVFGQMSLALDGSGNPVISYLNQNN